MAETHTYIRFDWAMKRMLRDKANYVILEGLLTTLLGRKITIQRLLESESNATDAWDKTNRVDLLAEDADGELVIIEVQNNSETAYFQRMLFGTSKLVTEYIQRGQGYERVRKIYSINIVYFPLGKGNDYVYHGRTEFKGIHTGEVLQLSPFQLEKFGGETPADLYPEYYILRVNDFNKFSRVPLEQWIYFLNTGEVPEDADAPGLPEVRQQLKLDTMTREELNDYYRHLDNAVILKDNIETGREEGRIEGRAEGRIEGRAEGRIEGCIEGRAAGRAEGRVDEKMDIARKMKLGNMPVAQIAQFTGLTIEQIEAL